MLQSINYQEALAKNIYPDNTSKHLHFKGIDAAQKYLNNNKKVLKMKNTIIFFTLTAIIIFSAYGYMTHKLCRRDHSPEQLKAMQLDCSKPWYLNL